MKIHLMKMASIYRFLVCSVFCVYVIQCEQTSAKEQLFLGRFPIPDKKTNGPINIITKKANKENYSSLKLQRCESCSMKLINTGKAVELIDEHPFTKSTITGGVFLGDTYLSEKTKFLWTNQKNGRAGISVDGKGYSLEAVNYFYNKKYNTFKNSLNHRDGIATIRFPITICSSPSSTFPPFAKDLKKILNAGNSTKIAQYYTSYEWFNRIPTNVTYYAYPGSYGDEKTGKYYSETGIVPDHPGGCISDEQFADTFGSMKNPLGKPLQIIEKLYSFRKPVIQAKGLVQKIFQSGLDAIFSTHIFK